MLSIDARGGGKQGLLLRTPSFAGAEDCGKFE